MPSAGHGVADDHERLCGALIHQALSYDKYEVMTLHGIAISAFNPSMHVADGMIMRCSI